MLILVSFLHLGQYKGKLIKTVSLHTLVRVLESQTGQQIQYDWCNFLVTFLPLRTRLLRVLRLAYVCFMLLA